MKKEKRFNQLAGVLNANAKCAKNILLTDAFINFIKIYGISPLSHKISATRKQHLSRQVLQVARRVAMRKKILSNLKSLLNIKLLWGADSRIAFRMTVRVH